MPTFREALRFWLKLGFINFGGPAGQIAIMHDELVDRKKWISQGRFMHALNYCMLLPGPEAMQLATYVGWLLHGTWGGLAAGILFVLPGAVFMLGLSLVYATWGDVAWVHGLFRGLGPVVVAIVAGAVIRVAKKSLHNAALGIVAGATFLALFMFSVPFPAVVVAAAIIGLAGLQLRPAWFEVRHADEPADTGPADALAANGRPSGWRSLRVLAVHAVLWAGPIVGLWLWRGWDDNLVRLSVFFSIAAMVTFGGAYAVLGYVADAAVNRFGWLRPGEMTVGLGFAESTPGPLILTLQFVGFLAGYKLPPAGWSPVTTGIVATLLTLWMTFVPCFLWIFLGAPYVERLRGHRRLDAMLSAITAAVVGVILDLALTLGIRVIFRETHDVAWGPLRVLSPAWRTVDILSLAAAVAAFVGILRWKWNIVAIVAAGAALGLLRALAG